MQTEDDFYAEMAEGEATYAAFDEHGDLCAGCGRIAFGLLCDDCEDALRRSVQSDRLIAIVRSKR